MLQDPTPPASQRLFPAILAERFGSLPPLIQQLHLTPSPAAFAGKCRIARGTTLLSQVMAAATRLPQASESADVTINIVHTPNGEEWQRQFAGRPMFSQLSQRHGLLAEKLGLVTFLFKLHADGKALTWRIHSVRAVGLPLPSAWFTGVVAQEGVAVIDGELRYTFDVKAHVPWVGLIVHYQGWLKPA